MKILCPTDVSREANNAVAYAAKLAHKTGSTLTLLNVQVLADLTPAEALSGEEANVRNAQTVLDQQSLEVSALFKIDCHAVVVPSLMSLTSIIRSEAREYDLVVMGSDGPDTFMESLFGTKTYRLASKSPLPVLVVPNNAGYSDVQTILYAFDYRRVSKVPVEQVMKLARLTSSEIIMLQIIEERWTRQVEIEMLSAQSKLRSTWPIDIPVRFETVYADDHSDSLRQYSGSFNADIVAIGFHGSGGIFDKSKTREIIATASYPLLVVHS